MDTVENQMNSTTTLIRGALLTVAFTGGVVPYFFTESDSARGVGLAGAAVLALLLQLLLDPVAIGTLLRPSRTCFALLCAFTGILSYGVLRAIYHGNDQYYLMAELYHWLVELTLIAVVTRLALTGSPVQSARVTVLACFLISAVTVALVAGCYAGVVPGGGYFQAGSRFWHLKAGVNFPQIPLILAWLTTHRCRSIGNGYRTLGWIATAACCLLLVMTLKRTMWLSTIGCVACVMLPKGQIRQLATWTVLAGIVVIAGVVARGSDMFGFLDFMTYNESYSVTDTMEDRTNQLSDAVRLFSTAGEGFGAEVDIYKVNSNKVERVHYIHSLYVFQIVQFGVPVGIFFILLLFGMILHVQSRSSLIAVNDWRCEAGLACLLAVAVNGITLVSLHSAFAGVSLGVALAAINERTAYSFFEFASDYLGPEQDPAEVGTHTNRIRSQSPA